MFGLCVVIGCDDSASNADYQTYSNLESKNKEAVSKETAGETEETSTSAKPVTANNDTVQEQTPAVVTTPPAQAIPPQWTKPVVAPLPDDAEPKRTPEVLVKEKKFRTIGPEKALQVTYEDLDLLKVINLEPVTPIGLKILPEWFKSLDGQRIRIRGIMFPPFEETGLTKFGLARDEQACCFGPNAKVYHLIDIHLRDGHETDYNPGQYFEVVGVFHLKPESQDDEVFSLYEIDDAIVVR